MLHQLSRDSNEGLNLESGIKDGAGGPRETFLRVGQGVVGMKGAGGATTLRSVDWLVPFTGSFSL